MLSVTQLDLPTPKHHLSLHLQHTSNYSPLMYHLMWRKWIICETMDNIILTPARLCYTSTALLTLSLAHLFERSQPCVHDIKIHLCLIVLRP
jgi:hypothetical protein